jgi:hypothetical protein
VRVSNGGVFPSAIEVPVDVDLDVPLTLIAYPTYPIGSSPGISAAMLADTGAWVPGGKSKLRVVHLAATTGDMQIWRRQPDAPAGNPIMTPLAYGAASQYLQSDAGVWEVWLTAPGGGAKLLSSGPIQIPSGDRAACCSSHSGRTAIRRDGAVVTAYASRSIAEARRSTGSTRRTARSALAPLLSRDRRPILAADLVLIG